MRTLDFGKDLSLACDGKLVVTNRPRLCARIIAYLAWPECIERRHQYLATSGAQHLQHVFAELDEVERECLCSDPQFNDDAAASRECVQELIAAEKMHSLQENFAVFGGGFGPLARAASSKPLQDELDEALHDATMAGQRLLLTATMAAHHAKDLRGGASLGKATDLLAWMRGKNQEAKSRNPIMEAWSGHQTVAHLAAAAVVIGCGIMKSKATANGIDVPPVTFLMVLKHTEKFIQLSQDFLAFGLAFKSVGSTQTILDGETVWHLPVNVASRPLERVLPLLTDQELKFLDETRWAPVPID